MIFTAGQINTARICDTPIGGSLIVQLKRCEIVSAQVTATITESCNTCALISFEVPCINKGYYDFVLISGNGPVSTINKIYVQK